MARLFGESSGNNFVISLFETTAWTAPDSPNPKINGHKISQNMANAIQRAWPKALISSVIGNRPYFSLALTASATKLTSMKTYTKILFSILAAALCTVSFAADKPNCKATGKNCPMNNGKTCKCGKDCGCAKM